MVDIKWVEEQAIKKCKIDFCTDKVRSYGVKQEQKRAGEVKVVLVCANPKGRCYAVEYIYNGFTKQWKRVYRELNF